MATFNKAWSFIGLLVLFVIHVIVIYSQLKVKFIHYEDRKNTTKLYTFIHYKDNWQNIADTNWTVPTRINTKFYGKDLWKGLYDTFEQWNYSIIDYPIIPNFLKSKKTRMNDMITIVTQCSLDRTYMITLMAMRWKEIISLSIYVPLEKMPFEPNSSKKNTLLQVPAIKLVTELWKNIEKNTEAILDIHLLFETESILDIHRQDKELFGVLYPINHLRNIALQCATSKFVLLSDVDFMPSDNFHILAKQNYNKSLEIIPISEIYRNYSDIALIVPAFELNLRKIYNLSKEQEYTFELNTTDSLPMNKTAVVKSYKNGLSVIFHQKTCRSCHPPTNYAKWITSDTPYMIQYQKSYEPYILMQRVGARRYDARFRGYGSNKMFHLAGLAVVDKINWIVASDCFLFHVPHKRSASRQAFNKGSLKHWLYGLVNLVQKELYYENDSNTGYITG